MTVEWSVTGEERRFLCTADDEVEVLTPVRP